MRHYAIFFALLLTACNGAGSVTTRTPTGNPNAVVVLTQYSDLQCPACGLAHEKVVKPFLQKYGNQVRFDFMHFPLRQIHRFALDAAEMSECAADQGKFWEFVNLAFERQDELSFASLVLWAGEVGMNTDEAERCWKSHSKRGIVLGDYKKGREQGVGATPTFFVNGAEVENGFDTLSEAIDGALGKVKMDL